MSSVKVIYYLNVQTKDKNALLVGLRICWPYPLRRGKILPKRCVLGMTLNWIWQWDSNFGYLGSVKYSFIAIILLATLIVMLWHLIDFSSIIMVTNRHLHHCSSFRHLSHHSSKESVEKGKNLYFGLARNLIWHLISPNQDDLSYSARTFISS